jgi:hypothetical protein
VQTAALFAVLILAALACFQVALAAGAPLGRLAWGGAHRVLPRRLRIASAVATVVYLAMAFVILEAAGVIDVLGADAPIGPLMWSLSAFFALGIVLNVVSRSRPERVMAGVSFVLCALFVLVARGA